MICFFIMIDDISIINIVADSFSVHFLSSDLIIIIQISYNLHCIRHMPVSQNAVHSCICSTYCTLLKYIYCNLALNI